MFLYLNLLEMKQVRINKKYCPDIKSIVRNEVVTHNFLTIQFRFGSKFLVRGHRNEIFVPLIGF